MTSIMSAEERSLLQDATRGGKQERATARPPESQADPVAIPKAAPVPRADGALSVATPVATAAVAAVTATPSATPATDTKPPRGIPLAVVVPFVVLALIVLYALTAMK